MASQQIRRCVRNKLEKQEQELALPSFTATGLGMVSVTRGIPMQCACSGTQLRQHATQLQTSARAVRQSLEPSCSYVEQEQGRALPQQPLCVSRRTCGLAMGAAALAYNARPARAFLSAPAAAFLSGETVNNCGLTQCSTYRLPSAPG